MTSSFLAMPLLGAACLLGLAACAPMQPTRTATDRVAQAPFGTLPDGRAVTATTLTNASGVTVRVLDYGGIIQSIQAPDRDGTLADVTLGFDTLDGYLGDSPYFGALIGRYGNRIAKGRFALDGQTYSLATNNGPNSLHGGVESFDKVMWSVAPFETETSSGVVLTRTSPDGEEGFPGALAVKATYTLSDDDELAFDYHATTTKPTPVNLTQHAYFNLTGTQGASILGHELMLSADRFTPVDATLIPTGELRAVAGTPFDFRQPHAIGERIDAETEQIGFGPGYDHNWVLNGPMGGLHRAAVVYEPTSGRVLTIDTTEPGIQFYAGNFLDGSLTGKGGVRYGRRTGIALETQHFPDSPNQAAFPSTILRPGETYRSRSVYTFSAR